MKNVELTSAPQAELPQWLQTVSDALPPLVDYLTIANLCSMNKGSLCNLVSEGKGPRGGVIIAKRKVYPKAEVVSWIAERAQANMSR